MNWIKRIARLALVNISVVLTISIILFLLQKFFGINIWTRSSSILLMASILWFGGAFISLFMSKVSAKSAYDMQMITETNLEEQDPKLQFCYQIIKKIASENWFDSMPEVGYYNSSEPNAFATWSSKNNSMVAISSWLLTLMKEDEIKWVLGHEMSHIINWDMVTMTLLNWVMNTFVFWLSRVISMSIKWDNEKEANTNPFIVIILERVFWFFGMIVCNRFSRIREYRADEWSVKVQWSNDYMIQSLQKLQLYESHYEVSNTNDSNMKIISWKSFANLFSTHPTLSDRIAALKQQ